MTVLRQVWRWVIEPGFLSSQPVHIALAAGSAVAVICAVTGVFTVMRGQSFGGHALSDVSAAGGSGALLAGLSPLVGFIGLGIAGAGIMDMIGVRRLRGRDLATGIVLGSAIGLSALFLQLNTTVHATTGAPQQILFGSIFTTSSDTLPAIVILGLVALGSLALAWRPLLLDTVSPEIAAARGIRVRPVGLLFMLALAVSVGLSSLVVGAILSTALLIGPAATALRLTQALRWAVPVACLIGAGSIWLGILLTYDSYDWGRSHQSLPASFFIVAVVFASYLLSGLSRLRGAAQRAGNGPEPGAGAAIPAEPGLEGECACSPRS